MNTQRTDVSNANLQKAFSTAFARVVARDRESGITISQGHGSTCQHPLYRTLA